MGELGTKINGHIMYTLYENWKPNVNTTEISIKSMAPPTYTEINREQLGTVGKRNWFIAMYKVIKQQSIKSVKIQLADKLLPLQQKETENI